MLGRSPGGRLVLSDTARRSAGELLAGTLTAVVFYTEYIGLGVVLGSALPGPDGAALGSLMVIGAVLVNCLLGAALRQPLLAGPRAASIAVLVAGMTFASSHASRAADELAVAMTSLATMLVVAAVVQLAGLSPRVRAWVCCTSMGLRKGFVFSTAVGMVASLSWPQLGGCLHVAPAGTLLVVASGVVAALSWSAWCRTKGGAPRRRALAPLSLLLGVGVAYIGYDLMVAPAVADGWCAAIGASEIPTEQSLQTVVWPQLWLSSSTLVIAFKSLPLWVWLITLLLGALLGLVLLLESLSMLHESNHQTPPEQWGMHLKMRALANLLCAPAGLACSSLAIVRTNALIESAGRTQLAVVFHGLALVAILIFFNRWISAVPHLVVAVALLLLAIQMIDADTRALLWRAGRHAGTEPLEARQSRIFLLVVAVSLCCGAALCHFGWGFAGGPLLALLVGTSWTGWRFMRRRHALAQSRFQSAPTRSKNCLASWVDMLFNR